MKDGTRETILVVDDHQVNRYSTARLLHGGGFGTIEAASGQEAIAVATAQRPDLIILDVNLPDLDGFEVCKVLRSLQATRQLPIVHVSATFVSDADLVQGLEGGADGYLVRPLDPLVLLATVRACIRARRAEQAVVKSQRELQSMADNTPDVLCRFDSQLRHTFINAAAERYTGIAQPKFIGKTIAEWPLSAEVRDGWIAAVQSVFHSGLASALELDCPAAEGVVNFSMRLVPERNEEGVVESVLCVLRDVTIRRRIELQREALLEAERTARVESDRNAKAKDEFLATASHELRTPIAAILGWSHVLRQTENEAVWRRGLEVIERNAKMQAGLINELLEMNRIASGKLRLNLSEISFDQLVQDAIDSILPSAEAKSIHIDFHKPGQRMRVRGDGSRLQQVVCNVLTNAVKFTPDHGMITVTLEHDRSWVTLSIRDNGEGIDPDFLSHLFERFTQADASAARKHGGLGLGLSITKQIVELHGGNITATSSGTGHGATFIIALPGWDTSISDAADRHVDRIPSEESQAEASANDALVEEVSLAGVRVMLVDDQADALEFAKRLLAEADADVMVHTSATDALASLRSIVPHVLISDIGMPQVDGYTFIGRVRSELGLVAGQLPAIAVSAFSREEDRQRALQAGFQEHIAKPINPRHLLNTIARLVRITP